MRPMWRRLLLWLPWVWLVAFGALTWDALTSKHGGGFVILSPLFIVYGLAFAWLSRFQIYEVRLGDDAVEFVSPARTMPMLYDDLVEIAPARGALQSRFATRFRTDRTRVTVLGRLFPGFEKLVAELGRLTDARLVRPI